jgi:hypothetical protein
LSGNGWLSFARSALGNGSVPAGTGNGQHRYARCKDRDCERLPCVAYKDGYQDGYDDGYEDGYGAGYSAGEAAGYAAGYAAAEAAASG